MQGHAEAFLDQSGQRRAARRRIALPYLPEELENLPGELTSLAWPSLARHQTGEPPCSKAAEGARLGDGKHASVARVQPGIDTPAAA
jgi:hypothetical protein